MENNIYVNIVDSKIDISELYDLCTHPEAGAVLCFGGTTRNNFENKEVLSLEYESYTEYALKEMKNIANSLIQEGALKVALVHRIGNVPVEETSVCCVVSTGHRPECFSLCRKSIDTLKEKVAIWKKEIYKDGHLWKENSG